MADKIRKSDTEMIYLILNEAETEGQTKLEEVTRK